MSFSITEASSELSAMLHGTNLSQVENVNGVFNRAARQLLLDIDPAETKRILPLATPVYHNIFDYALPEDLKGNKIIDVIPPSLNNTRDKFTQGYNQAFDMFKKSRVNNFTIINDSSEKYLRLAYSNTANNVLVNSANGILTNGTWVASGTASNLQEDNLNTDNDQPSLKFDVATGTGYLTNSTMEAVDLSSHYNASATFFDLNIPANLTNITSLEIRFGSSSTDYYEKIGIIKQYNGTSFQLGYNTIGVDWSNMALNGSPDNTKINYVRIGIVCSGSTPSLNLAQIWNNLGFIFNIEYYSKFLFRNASTGAWQEKVLSNDDLINLDTESYNLFLYQAAFLCVQQALGQDAGYDTNIFLDKYNQALSRYKKMYKSECQHPQTTWYSKPRQGYSGVLNTRSRY